MEWSKGNCNLPEDTSEGDLLIIEHKKVHFIYIIKKPRTETSKFDYIDFSFYTCVIGCRSIDSVVNGNKLAKAPIGGECYKIIKVK